MAETKKMIDPFLNKEVEISTRLTDRLRGKYANGPTMANGQPEFGWREFPTPPVQHEAADEITRLRAALDAIGAMFYVDQNGDVLLKPDQDNYDVLCAANEAIATN